MEKDVDLDFSVTHDDMGAFLHALESMQAKDVLAGFPAEEEPRKVEDGEEKEPITNAALGYIHNTGMPEQNIPARPFMVEGIEAIKDKVISGMETVGVAALDGNSQAVEQGLHAVGMTATLGIQNKILDGPFQPLAESTLKGRVRNAGSEVARAAQEELDSRAAGNAPNVDISRPLNVTEQMRNAVYYVVRDK